MSKKRIQVNVREIGWPERLMGPVVSIPEAEKHFSRIVDEVTAGAEVIIAKAGKPLVRLSPISAPSKTKKVGQLKGKIKVTDRSSAKRVGFLSGEISVPDDFDEMGQDKIETAFGRSRSTGF